MKRILSLILVLITVAALALPAAAVENSNHYIEEDYPTLYKNEKYWQVYGWTVVDTEIVSVGYIFDDGEIVWAVPEVDVRDNNSKVEDIDAFRDHELEGAIVAYGLTNGLDDFFAYRIMITIDLTDVTSGKHSVEVVAKYSDGFIENPFRGEMFSFKKKSGPAGVTTEEATEAATEKVTEKAPETEKQTEAATEVQTEKPAETEKATEKPADQTTEPKEKNNNTLVIILIIVAAVAAFAVGAVFILKKKKQ